ncbi:hypothetical protein KFU94_65910 [Chloroflexi bacterium TSY]|nr:hypothetical protein [Chloroflexi bacterium TSY]
MRNIQTHLTDEEFVAFISEDLSTELEQDLDRHLELCVSCAKQLEDYFLAQEEFPDEIWIAHRDEFKASLSNQFLVPERPSALLKRLANQLRDLILTQGGVTFSLAAAQAATNQQIEEGQTKDGMLRWRIVEDEEKNLVIRLASHQRELDGIKLRLWVGEWQDDLTLHRVASDQVGAETLIPCEEREQLPVEAALHIELLIEDIASQNIE